MKGSNAHRTLTWPLATLDFEASGLTVGSYPIEIGLCIWREPDAPLQVWSTLIRPVEKWLEHGEWSTAAEAVHGLRHDDLSVGVSPTEAVERANACLIGLDVAWCDGGAWDVHWARALARASDVRPLFGIGHVDMLTATWPRAAVERMARFLNGQASVHRAGPDAERLMRALARAIGVEPGPAVGFEPGGGHRG